MHIITFLEKGNLLQCFVQKVQVAIYTLTITTEIYVGTDIPQANSWADIN